MTARVIEGPACIAEGCAHIARVEPRFAAALRITGPPPLRRGPEGFVALRDIVVGQMVSTAAARAISARLDAAGFDDAAVVCGASDAALTACGLSRQKRRTVRAVAAPDLDLAGLRALSDDQVIRTLTAVPGIGPWSAQIYLMTALGRADAFPAGDLALQEAARRLFALDSRPPARDLARLAVPWSPWRGVAARALWAYYRETTGKEGLA